MYVHSILTPQYHFVAGTLLHRCYFKELSTIGSNKLNYISCINFIDLIVEMNKKYSIEEVTDFVTLPDLPREKSILQSLCKDKSLCR